MRKKRIDQKEVDHIWRIVRGQKAVTDWLKTIRDEKREKRDSCLFCSKKTAGTDYFFCHKSLLKIKNHDEPPATRPRLSRCAFLFYRQHPHKLVEWITE